MNDEQLIWESYVNNSNYLYRGMNGNYLNDVIQYGLHPRSPENHEYNELTWPEFSKWQVKWENQNKYEYWDDFIENTKKFPAEAIEERLYFTPDLKEAESYADMSQNPVLLRINKNLVSWKVAPKPYHNHWYTYESISPENIDIKSNEEWIPLTRL